MVNVYDTLSITNWTNRVYKPTYSWAGGHIVLSGLQRIKSGLHNGIWNVLDLEHNYSNVAYLINIWNSAVQNWITWVLIWLTDLVLGSRSVGFTSATFSAKVRCLKAASIETF